jgi:hypothetical protein
MDPKQQRVAAIVLVLLAVGVWARGAWSGRGARSNAAGRSHWPTAAAPSAPTAEQILREKLGKAPEPSSALPWGENPFVENRRQRTAPSEESPQRELVLNGILWDARTPTAVINDRVVSRGDRIGPWEVVEIQKERVLLSDGATTQVLESQ